MLSGSLDVSRDTSHYKYESASGTFLKQERRAVGILDAAVCSGTRNLPKFGATIGVTIDPRVVRAKIATA